MDLEIGAWKVEEKRNGRIRLSRGDDVIHINRDDDKMACERWFFDFEPDDGYPVSEQLRVEDEAGLHDVIGMLIEKHA